MGMARNNWSNGSTQRNAERRRVAEIGRGVPVPGTGVNHWHRSPSGNRNPAGGIHTVSEEWGSKDRKEEAALRGLNNTARREAISDQEYDPDDDLHAVHVYDRLDELSDDLLEDACGEGMPSGVTFNGENYDPSYAWWNEGDGFDDYDPRDWDSE